MLYSPKLKIVLITLLILGALAVGLYAVVIFWPVADAERRSDLIICLGGNTRARQEKTLKLYNERYAQKLLLTNQSHDYFLKNGVSSSNIYVTSVPGNTFEEAQYCQKFMEEHKINSALVVSDWWHLRRVKWSFETVFQGTGMGIRYISAQPEAAETGYYLQAHRIKLILEEMVKLLGYWVRY
ncbi:MAG: YdcF family protein [Proteobacteria bacterium]|nr:YdcF family protein [Desulfobacteraceae bacterium]MBU4013086.1 YdcF family protein [Pseudomonadota bacterium]MBU4103406.1 YdcF family protein [Patescibacteria group bacterium]